MSLKLGNNPIRHTPEPDGILLKPPRRPQARHRILIVLRPHVALRAPLSHHIQKPRAHRQRRQYRPRGPIHRNDVRLIVRRRAEIDISTAAPNPPRARPARARLVEPKRLRAENIDKPGGVRHLHHRKRPSNTLTGF